MFVYTHSILLQNLVVLGYVFSALFCTTPIYKLLCNIFLRQHTYLIEKCAYSDVHNLNTDLQATNTIAFSKRDSNFPMIDSKGVNTDSKNTNINQQIAELPKSAGNSWPYNTKCMGDNEINLQGVEQVRTSVLWLARRENNDNVYMNLFMDIHYKSKKVHPLFVY